MPGAITKRLSRPKLKKFVHQMGFNHFRNVTSLTTPETRGLHTSFPRTLQSMLETAGIIARVAGHMSYIVYLVELVGEVCVVC